jgi:hypothetical protein
MRGAALALSVASAGIGSGATRGTRAQIAS